MNRHSMLLLAAIVFAPASATAQTPDNSSLDIDPDTVVSDAYQESIDDRNRQNVDDAHETGESAIPYVIGQATAPDPAEDPQTEVSGEPSGYVEPDPETTIRNPSSVLEPVYSGYGSPTAAPGQDLSDLIAILVEEWSREPTIVTLGYAGATGQAADPEAATPVPAPSPRAPVEPGRPLYARVLYEVNSDYPGPVLLEILEPPLAGAIATGGFEVVGDRMALRLNRLEHEGRSTAVDGWAVGLDCACYGIAGEVDRHWFDRVILPAAIAFATGWADALARPSTTVTVQGDIVVEDTGQATSKQRLYEGAANAASVAGAVLQEDSPRRMTVRIPRNTELAVTFTTPPVPAAQTLPTFGQEAVE